MAHQSRRDVSRVDDLLVMMRGLPELAVSFALLFQILFAIYGIGVVAAFTVLAGLYSHAYARRRELDLTALEIVEVGAYSGRERRKLLTPVGERVG